MILGGLAITWEIGIQGKSWQTFLGGIEGLFGGSAAKSTAGKAKP